MHGFVNDFKEWEFSSCKDILKNDNTFLGSQKKLDWFGGVVAIENVHSNRYGKEGMGKFIIE